MPTQSSSPDRKLITRRQTHRGQFFTEKLNDSIGLDMMLIPSGSFMMGQTEKEKKELIRLRDEKKYQTIYLDELPRHLVIVPSFFMGKYPITQDQWHIVATSYQKVIQELNPTPSHFKGDCLPVEQVSWDDAQEFCRRLSNQHTTRTYRLPSESEWEYACRALPISLADTFRADDVLNEGDLSFPFHFGETIDATLANYCVQDREISKKNYPGTYDRGVLGEYREKTTEVGTFSANAFGLYDMHGNVLEWCEDDLHSDYKGAPDDGSAWVESDRKNARKLLRGGSWNYDPVYCRSANRNFSTRDDRNFNVGFRVSCSLGIVSSR
jgi:formylglycine-generating enzyme required for sulfatase activity